MEQRPVLVEETDSWSVLSSSNLKFECDSVVGFHSHHPQNYLVYMYATNQNIIWFQFLEYGK